jgi:hypothetical protein
MDVRIGELEATIVDSDGAGDLSLDRIAQRVMALIEQRQREERNLRSDRRIASPDGEDQERYG